MCVYTESVGIEMKFHEKRLLRDIRKTPVRAYTLTGLFFSYRCPAQCPCASSCKHGMHTVAAPELMRYIIPDAPAGMGGMGSLMFATAASVVRKLEATLVAFWRALLVTLAGSRIPPSIMLTYSSL